VCVFGFALLCFASFPHLLLPLPLLLFHLLYHTFSPRHPSSIYTHTLSPSLPPSLPLTSLSHSFVCLRAQPPRPDEVEADAGGAACTAFLSQSTIFFTPPKSRGWHSACSPRMGEKRGENRTHAQITPNAHMQITAPPPRHLPYLINHAFPRSSSPSRTRPNRNSTNQPYIIDHSSSSTSFFVVVVIDVCVCPGPYPAKGFDPTIDRSYMAYL
jgi:hypothetical protein